MKLKYFVLIGLLPLFAFQCDKKLADNCLQGKVVRITCATTVIQVLNTDSIGEDGWKDGSENSITYDNVFSVANKCDLPATIKTGDILTFNIGEPSKNDCIVCMMYDAPPKVSLGVVNVNECAVK